MAYEGAFHSYTAMDTMAVSDSALPPADVVCLVLGGAGFIGSHVAARLVASNRCVVVADQHPCAYFAESTICSSFVSADLRDHAACMRAFNVADAQARLRFGSSRVWVFLFAADMGGMGYIASNESAILLSNTSITANVVRACLDTCTERLFVASSACVYPVELQSVSGEVPALREDVAWPAHPQDGYGLEKLYGEELAMRAAAASGGRLEVRVARFHNVYGPRGTWIGGREKAPAAFLRKALLLRELDAACPGHGYGIEIWGDGCQTRTFCFITDAVTGVLALMCSDVATPVNIGSDEAVTVKELALLAGDAAGFDRVSLAQRLVYQPAGPIGVQSRSADLSKARGALGWAPRVPLATGITATGTWLAGELARLRHASGLHEPAAASAASESAATPAPGALGSHWITFLRSGLTSPHTRARETRRFGLLVPVTSRYHGRAVEGSLRTLLCSLRDTTTGIAAQHAWQFNIFFGVDAGDAVCDPAAPDALDFVRLVQDELPEATALGHVTARVRTFSYPPGNVCRIWSDLAFDAVAAGNDFTVLLGDDVVLQSQGWADAILSSFQSIATATGLPFGFGCVAFADGAFPGFPTFPVLHRTHFDVFAGRAFPTSFKNQDADPFLFQLYRAFGAARLEPAARLTNTVGGAGDARYRKLHVPWTGETLSNARAAAQQWLDLRLPLRAVLQPPVVTLDVVVPTYRVPRAALDRILALRVPAGVSTQFTVICDRPGDAAAAAVIEALQAAHVDDPMVRIRTNAANIGAGPTRNRGLAESAAEWVLFLDDDVVPEPDILEAYAAAIRAHPQATGFIGHSILPPPVNGRQAGVHIAGVAFFWGIAQANPLATELPWGVTANLCVRRPPPGTVEFSAEFPKTGGGEDIDYCLRLREYVRRTVPNSEGFVAAPAAVITHPWWDGGAPHYSHFSGWAGGDGHLIDLYPALTYRNLPDLTETLLLLLASGATQLGVRAALAANIMPAGTLPRLSALLRSATSHRALAGTAIVAGACVAGDLLLDTWLELIERPSPHCAHLPLASRVAGVVQGLVIRTVSEAGRLLGHAARGTVAQNFGRRFNWFGYMWAGAPAVERVEALRRNLVRAAVAAAAVALLLRTRRRGA